MALQDELRAAAARQGPGAAAALLERYAAAGRTDALEMLGQWRLWGMYGPGDAAAGYRAIAAAAAAGSVEAGLTQAALLSTGTGVAADGAAVALVRALAPVSALARRQIAIVDADVPPPIVTVLRNDPYVARVEGLLSADECAYLIERVGGRVQPSMVVDPRTGRRVPNPIRDSHGANVAPVDEDIVIHAINRRIAAATATDWAQGEPLHLLRYAPGQQYRPHLDALPGVSNQRVLTALVYLNADYEGGETRFKDGLAHRGAAGDMLVFANVRADGTVDPRTEHAGTPVTGGTKWLATRLIRARPFDFWTR